MRYISLRLLAIVVIASVLSGCGSGLHPTTSSSTVQNLTGNWFFDTDITPAQAMTSPIYAFTGAINSQGANVSAVFRAISGTCISPSQDIVLTGSQAADGTVTLTSTNLPNNVATVTLNFSTLYNLTSGEGTISITGSGPCAISTGLGAYEVQPVTGAYTGTISAASGFPSTATGTANLTQAAATSDGLFPVTGSITIAGISCSSTFSLTGLITGPNLSATLVSTSGPTATGSVQGTTNAGIFAPSLTLSINILSSGCNNGAFNATLNSQ
jgi:hypothetical protein